MKWNIAVVLSILLIGAFQANAQRARYKPQAHELSVQLGAADAVFPFLSRGDYRDLPFAPQAANGLRYTYHLSLTDGIRASFFNRTAPLNYSVQNVDARRVERQFQIGYERKYHNGPHQVSFGPEILANLGFTEYPTGGEEFPFQSIGAALALGYSYFFSPYVSASFEGNLYYINPSYSTILTNPNEFPAFISQENITGITVGVWLNFHFVKQTKRCKCPSRR